MDAKTISICTGSTIGYAERFASTLSQAMDTYDINTPVRQAMFLSNVGHESGYLRYTTELWGPTPAQQRYEGRKDLGNVRPGDGSLFRGRGLLQTTGRANYASVRNRLRLTTANVPDFEREPARLSEAYWASFSAADFWDMKNLNSLADQMNFIGVVRKINGGTNGLDDRLRLYKLASDVLGAA